MDLCLQSRIPSHQHRKWGRHTTTHPATNRFQRKRKKRYVLFSKTLNILQKKRFSLWYIYISFLFFLQTLSPVRLNQRSRTKLHNLNRESQQLSKKHDHFSSIDGQPLLKESQASTVFGFSPDRNTASSDMDEPKQSGKMGESSVSQVQGGQEDSVLAKYVLMPSVIFLNRTKKLFHNDNGTIFRD